MNPVPIAYLHLETGVILLFLAMVLRTQFGRASDPGYFVQRGRFQLRWLASAFLLMSVAFSALLFRASPLLGVELAAAVTLSMMHPVNALCFMVHMMILRPWEIEFNNPVLMALPRLMVLLCVFSWLLHPGQHADISWRGLRGVLFLVAFSGWLLLTTTKAANPAQAQSDWFDIYVKSLTIFAMALFLVESERSVREVQMTLVVSSLSIIADGYYQYFTDALKYGRLASVGLLGDPNDMAAVIVMALPFALVPAFEETSGLMTKGAALLYAVLAAGVIWLTRSRGAMLAVLAQFLVVRLARNSRDRLRLALLAAVIGVGYGALLHFVPRDEAEMAMSEDSRITLWKTGANMALHNPLLGVGFNQFPASYEGYVVGNVVEWGKRTAHSSWFLALGESGFVGCFLFMAFFVSVVRVAWRNRVQRPAQLYAVAGYGVAMSFLSHTYSQYYYLLMGLVLGSTSVKVKVPDEP